MTILKSQDELNFDKFERFCLEEGYVNIDTVNRYRKLLLKYNMSIEEVYKHNVKTKKNIRGFGHIFNNAYKVFSDLLEINDLYEPSMDEKYLLHDLLGTIVPNSHVVIRVVDPNLANKMKRLRTSTIKYIDVELPFDYINIEVLVSRHSLLVNLNYQLVDQIKREFEVKKESCVNINHQLELLKQRLLYRYGKLIDAKQIDNLIDLEYIVNRVIPENPFFKEMVISNVKNELKITNIFIDPHHIVF